MTDFFDKVARNYKPPLPVLVDKPPIAPDCSSDHEWVCTEKLDGTRLVVAVAGASLIGFSRNMKEKEIPKEVATQIFTAIYCNRLWGTETVYEGELVDDIYHIFMASKPFSEGGVIVPHSLLLLALDDPTYPNLKKVQQTTLERAEEKGLEGVVYFNHFTRKSGLQGRTRALQKIKFRKTADCIVYEKWRQGKRAVSLAVMENGKPVDVGGLTVPEIIIDNLQIGDVVEIEYFRLTDNRKVYHASFSRKRSDKSPHECTFDQFI